MGKSSTSPDKWGGVGSELAAHLVVAHGRGDIRVDVQHLAASRDQSNDHDQGDKRKNQRVLDHSLCGLQVQLAHHRPESLTTEAPPLVVARANACSTTTRTIRFRQKWLRSALSRGFAGLAASSAASRTTSASSRFPFRKTSAAVASNGYEATADKTIRQPLTTSPSSWSATAAPAIGKSIEPRRRSFTYALRVFGLPLSRSAVTTSDGCFAIHADQRHDSFEGHRHGRSVRRRDGPAPGTARCDETDVPVFLQTEPGSL